ncbi:MFS transporter [Sinanaerobacter sp. ZZT-01]|uniref:MFS transporter n=1 Tax=Sinanaerobacter sp. ZZT-01 TaxID=3111540 RepID=UPI002D7A19DA|nr:MFS transporter [Sinanaerobacter sp. ZZT-01]WRR94931.1 MFS transporter [Sinanaerobacter sp. ZZT-01]
MNNSKQSFGKFILLWSGQLVSAIGSGLTAFGLGVYVYQQTGKVSTMALVTLLAFLPSLLLSAPAGVLADRYDRRLLMVIGDSLSAVGLVFILICMLYGEAHLWQICVGVSISSVFSSLLEPSYKATVTDLLTEEQYTKASGLVQTAASAKYLISPIIAGYLLVVSDIKLLLIIDISTFFVTVLSTFVVRRGLKAKSGVQIDSFICEFKEGWEAISEKRGVLILVMITSIITFFLGFIQTLSAPMILAFSDSALLGTTETICASGMLVTSVIVGIVPIKKSYVKLLSGSLFSAGLFMVGFGFRENLVLICIMGFLFFAMLPLANTSLDYLIRTNIKNVVQGRAWGLIGLISQLGYVIAYVLSGILSDYVFTPLLSNDGALAGTIGKVIGTGNGRGAGFQIIIAGMLLCVTAFAIYVMRSIKELEKRGCVCTSE